MAGDWIKMRTDLATCPKVVRISSALHADRLRTVGGLHSVWCLFDTHSVDGNLEGYTVETVDDLIGFPGFARAMIDAGWLDEIAGGLSLPRFEDHNGLSAKRRAMDSDRKRNVRNVSASEADKKRTREEKRREEIKERNDAKPSPAPSPKTKRKTAVPDPFDITAEMIVWANDRAPAADLTLETEKFLNYWKAKGETRADWVASWKNWMLNAQTYAGRRIVPNAKTGPDFDDLSWTQNLGGL
jgi:hypothetical protein